MLVREVHVEIFRSYTCKLKVQLYSSHEKPYIDFTCSGNIPSGLLKYFRLILLTDPSVIICVSSHVAEWLATVK